MMRIGIGQGFVFRAKGWSEG